MTETRLIRIGNACNNACIFCPIDDEGQSLSERHGNDLLEDGEEFDGQSVAIVGGEPTLYDCLPVFVQGIKHRGSGDVIVATNARRLVYPAYAAMLAEAGVDGLDVSLLGSTARMHDYHTSVEGSYEQTMRGVMHALEARMRVVVTCVVTRSNYRNMPDILQVVRGLGVRALRFRMPELRGKALKARHRIFAHPQLVVPYLRQTMMMGRRHGIEIVVGTASADGFASLSSGVEVETGEIDSAMFLPGRANPARHERRGKDRKTGEQLREILPKLFEPGEK